VGKSKAEGNTMFKSRNNTKQNISMLINNGKTVDHIHNQTSYIRNLGDQQSPLLAGTSINKTRKAGPQIKMGGMQPPSLGKQTVSKGMVSSSFGQTPLTARQAPNQLLVQKMPVNPAQLKIHKHLAAAPKQRLTLAGTKTSGFLGAKSTTVLGVKGQLTRNSMMAQQQLASQNSINSSQLTGLNASAVVPIQATILESATRKKSSPLRRRLVTG